MTKQASEFHTVFDRTESRDAFFRFLQVVFHLYPEDKFHHLIHDVCGKHDNDEAIYREVQRRLPEITPFLSVLSYGLPALRTQKKEMARETLELIGKRGELERRLGDAGLELARWNVIDARVEKPAPRLEPGQLRTIRI